MRSSLLLLVSCLMICSSYCCDSIRFENFVKEHFTLCDYSDTIIQIDEYINYQQIRHKDTSQGEYSSHYFGTNLWHSQVAYLLSNSNYLLKFGLHVETDSIITYDKRFLLCDVCGNILDSLILKKAEYEDINGNEAYSMFYVKLDTLKWSFYESLIKEKDWSFKDTFYDMSNYQIKVARHIEHNRVSYIVDW